MNVWVLTSVFDAQTSVTVYSEDKRDLAEEEFLQLFKEELTNTGDNPESIDDFEFNESYGDMFNGVGVYYDPNTSFCFPEDGYDVCLQLCEVN